MMISHLERKIENRIAIAATDASVKDDKIGGYWIMTDKFKRIHVENRLCHEEQENNASGVTEIIVLLELTSMIAKRSKHST